MHVNNRSNCFLQHTTARIRQNPGHDKTGVDLHPAWQVFMDLCRDVGHGEIERLKIQDGLPVFAEVITEKIKLT
jgi:hypothetical protein